MKDGTTKRVGYGTDHAETLAEYARHLQSVADLIGIQSDPGKPSAGIRRTIGGILRPDDGRSIQEVYTRLAETDGAGDLLVETLRESLGLLGRIMATSNPRCRGLKPKEYRAASNKLRLAAKQIETVVAMPAVPVVEATKAAKQKPAEAGPRKPRKLKWDLLWALIQKHNAEDGVGLDQKIANEHNKLCAAKIRKGECDRVDANKVAQVRYEYKNRDRHQKNKKRS